MVKSVVDGSSVSGDNSTDGMDGTKDASMRTAAAIRRRHAETLTEFVSAVTAQITYSSKLVLVGFLFDFLQLASFSLLDRSSWSAAFIGRVFSSNPFTSAYAEGNWVPAVLCFIVLTAHAIVVVYAIKGLWNEKINGTHWSFKVLGPFIGVVITIGYIPMLSGLLGFAISLLFDNTWGQSIPAIVLGLFLLMISVLFIGYALCMAACVHEKRPSLDVPLARSHCRVDLVHQLVRTCLVVSFIFFHDSSPFVCNMVQIASGGVLLVSYTKLLPYYDFLLSRTRAVIMGAVLSIAICDTIALLEANGDWGTLLLIVFTLPVQSLAVFLFVEHRKNMLLSSPIETITSPYVLDLKVRLHISSVSSNEQFDDYSQVLDKDDDGDEDEEEEDEENADEKEVLLKKEAREERTRSRMVDRILRRQHRQQQQQAHQQERGSGSFVSLEMFESLDNCFEQLATRFQSNADFHLLWGQFVFIHQGRSLAAVYHLKNALRNAPMWDVLFSIQTIQRETEVVLQKDCGDFLKYLKYQRLMQDAAKHDDLATNAQFKFFEYLHVSRGVDLDVMYDLGVRLESDMNMAKSLYEAAIRLSKTSPQDLRAYGSFLEDIYRQEKLAHGFFRQAERIENKRSSVQGRQRRASQTKHATMPALGALGRGKTSSENPLDVFDDRNMVVGLDVLGTIRTTNSITAQMTGYAAVDLVGKHCSVLVPPPFPDYTSAFEVGTHMDGSCEIISSFLRHQNGSIVPVEVDTRQVTVFEDEDVVSMSVFSKLNHPNHIIHFVIDTQDRVVGFTSNASSYFPMLHAGDRTLCSSVIPEWAEAHEQMHSQEGAVVLLPSVAAIDRLRADSDSDSGADKEDMFKDDGTPLHVRVLKPFQFEGSENVAVVQIIAGRENMPSGNAFDTDAKEANRLNLFGEQPLLIHEAESSKNNHNQAQSMLRNMMDNSSPSKHGIMSPNDAQSGVGVDTAWLRDMFLTYKDHDGAGIRMLKIVAAITCVLIIVASMTSYLVVYSNSQQYREGVTSMCNAQIIRSELAEIMTHVRTLIYINQNSLQASLHEAYARKRMFWLATDMQTRFEEYEDFATAESGELRAALLEANIKVKINLGTAEVQNINFRQLVWNTVNAAKLISKTPVAHLNQDTATIYFLVQNDLSSHRYWFNRTAVLVGEQTINNLSNMVIFEESFGGAVIAIVFLVIVFAWRPAVASADKGRTELIQLFLDIPRNDTQVLFRHSKKRVRQRNRANNQFHEGDEMDDENPETLTQFVEADKKTSWEVQIRIYGLLVLVACFFLPVMYVGTTQARQAKLDAWQVVFSGHRLEASKRLYSFSRDYAACQNITNKPVLGNLTLATVEYARLVHSSLLYGHQEWGNLALTTAGRQLRRYFEDNCDGSAYASCGTFYHKINTFGLDPLFSEYLFLVRNVDVLYTNTSLATANSTRLDIMTEMDQKYLSDGLYGSLIDYQDAAANKLDAFVSLRGWLTILFAVAATAYYRIVHVDLVQTLEDRTVKSHTMIINNLPKAILHDVGTISAFISAHVSLFHDFLK